MNTKSVINYRNYQRLGYQRLLQGVYAPSTTAEGDPWQLRRLNWQTRVKAVLKHYADKQPVLYGATALQALGVALPQAAQDWDVIHIMIAEGIERPRRAGVAAHRGRPGRSVWRTVNGMPVLHPVDHWLQIRGVTDDELTEIGDGFVRRKNPLLTIYQMQHRLSELSHEPGVVPVRRAMRLVLPDTDSIYETKTRLLMIRCGLPTPTVNYPVWCPRSDFTYLIDMGYPDQKIGIEYDGAYHGQSREQMSMDADRRRNLLDAGWFMITVTADQLNHPTDFLDSIRRALVLGNPVITMR